ncbi:TRAP transporter small permease [Photobacterium sp. DNB23_23_1]|uniref:TRAP transporter small permease protein n=1 Tax=Photobacterium pectinilyticum TaxID=2906793 RepID=A0ABT1N927_9GAMM|nr:TRAP transporter small permease subunit [Photobacterium sp. ZSDE20]MCQ1061236.1 TRAP transporter small permease [Photobacterium sp. ZSDE20]MDD1829652.1 TRAP transporter small permease [Photobacterium sp. ZSDE20]
MGTSFKNLWGKLEEVICFVTFVVMLLLGFSNVVVRTLTNYSLASTQEIVINGMVVLTLFGAAIAIKRGQLLAVGFLIDNISDRYRKWLQVGLSIAVVFTLLVMFYFMLDLLGNQYESQITSSALQVKVWYYTALLPLGFVLMIARQIEWLITQLRCK